MSKDVSVVDSLFLAFNENLDNIRGAYEEFSRKLEELQQQIIDNMNLIIEKLDCPEIIKLDSAQADQKASQDLKNLVSGGQFQIRKKLFTKNYMGIARIRAVILWSPIRFDETDHTDKYCFRMIFNDERKDPRPDLYGAIKLKLDEDQFYNENHMRVGTDGELILAEFKIDNKFEDELHGRMSKIIKDVLKNIA